MREAIQRLEALEQHQQSQLSEMQRGFNALVTATNEQNAELRLLRQELINALTGKEQIPLPVAMTVFKALCFVIIGLVVWFTGVKYLAGTV